MEIEAEYIVGGIAFDVYLYFHLYTHPELQEVLTLTVVYRGF